MPTPITIEILTKEDCCLCDEAKSVVEQVIGDFHVELIMIDIESDPDLFEQYKEKIPVVKINGEESFVYKVHPITLTKKLEKIIREAK
jgi:glutaredoxin